MDSALTYMHNRGLTWKAAMEKKYWGRYRRNAGVPSITILDLPVEILLQIFSYVVPHRQSYRLATCLPYEPSTFEKPMSSMAGYYLPSYSRPPYVPENPQEEDEILAEQRKTLDNLTRGQSRRDSGYQRLLRFATEHRPDVSRKYFMVDALFPARTPDSHRVMPYLLIHPALTPVVRQILYSNNHISFPDVATLNAFVQKNGLRACTSVSSISIDARGPARTTSTCTESHYSFKEMPDQNIVAAVAQFPALKELILGGVGPGLRWNVDGYRRGFREDYEIWILESLELVARLIGLPDIKTDTKGDPTKPSAITSGAGPAALRDAHVICRAPPDDVYWFCESLPQAQGTRIIRKGEKLHLNEWECETFDLGAKLQVARTHDEARHQESLRRQEKPRGMRDFYERYPMIY